MTALVRIAGEARAVDTKFGHRVAQDAACSEELLLPDAIAVLQSTNHCVYTIVNGKIVMELPGQFWLGHGVHP